MRNLKRALSVALASAMLLGMMMVGTSAKGIDDFTDKDKIVNQDAVAVTAEIDDDTQFNIVWVSSSSLLDDTTNEMVSGSNQDLFLNALSWMCGQEEGITIHAKSLTADYLTVDSATASTMTAVIVAVIPLCCLGAGLFIWIRRKRQ